MAPGDPPTAAEENEVDEVFVSGLPPEATEEAIAKHFGTIGVIKQARRPPPPLPRAGPSPRPAFASYRFYLWTRLCPASLRPRAHHSPSRAGGAAPLAPGLTPPRHPAPLFRRQAGQEAPLPESLALQGQGNGRLQG
jgi:hypothetical protein